jgi:hypothetical protein
MRLRTVLSLTAPTFLAIACADAPAVMPTAVDLPSASAVAAVPEIRHTTLLLEHSLHEPCTSSQVEISGTLQLQSLARALDGDRIEIRYTALPNDVIGLAPSGDVAYHVLGAAGGALTTTHHARVVTVADFKVLVTPHPGVKLGRARVAPQLGVLIAFPWAADGLLQDPVIDGVFFAKGECGELPPAHQEQGD